MEWFSYQHLYYFWVVVKAGSIVAACKRLHLTQPTVSAQIQTLEAALGEALFHRVGRRLVPTEAGQLAARYAEEIFALGQEFLDTLKGRPTGPRPVLRVGVVDVIPKRIVRDILEPVFGEFEGIRLVCREEKADTLFLDSPSNPRPAPRALSPWARGWSSGTWPGRRSRSTCWSRPARRTERARPSPRPRLSGAPSWAGRRARPSRSRSRGAS